MESLIWRHVESSHFTVPCRVDEGNPKVMFQWGIKSFSNGEDSQSDQMSPDVGGGASLTIFLKELSSFYYVQRYVCGVLQIIVLSFYVIQLSQTKISVCYTQ